jgi:hypothetical protein
MTSQSNEDTNMYSREFSDIRVGRLFHVDGNDYIKQSSRTARMLANGRVFYFRQDDVVHPIAW